MLTNYHSHCTFCDGKASIDEFVTAAILNGFSHWGVSSHSPLPMLDQSPWALKIERVNDYIAAIEAAKDKHKQHIKVYAGMEIDYIDQSYNPASPYFQQLALDYRIGSVHLLRSPRTGDLVDIDCEIELFERNINYHFAGSLQKVVETYYQALTDMVLTGGFDFVAHADKVSSNTSALSAHIMDKEWYKELVDNFLVLCQKRGVILEINTKAYITKGVMFPDERYLARIAELGIGVIINSDAHRIERMKSGIDEAKEMATRYGCRMVELF